MPTPGGLYAPTSGGPAAFAPANAYGNGGYPMQPAGSYDAATGNFWNTSGELIYNWNTGKSIDSSITGSTGSTGSVLQSEPTAESAGSYQRSRILHTYVASPAAQPPNPFAQTALDKSMAGPVETGPLDVAAPPLRPEIPRQILDSRMSGTFMSVEIDASRSRSAAEAVRKQGIGGERAVRGIF